MKLKEFDYNLDNSLIAQEPIRPRDYSRLLVLKKKTKKIKHDIFYNIIEYLKPGDILVLNNSKVFPARLLGKRKTGGRVEIFLLHQANSNSWYCLVGGKKLQNQETVFFKNNLQGEINLKNTNSQELSLICFNKKGKSLLEVIKKAGETPLPPYIKREVKKEDEEKYQTVYAKENKLGSVAAPTAGFHFTEELLQKIKNKGIEIQYLTLHVSLGTFNPVKTETIEKHKMHAEWLEVSKETGNKLLKAKRDNKRIVAVGTTSVRTVETFFQYKADKKFLKKPFSAWTDIFIYPGYEFKGVNALITNFHLPKSTLLMLVSAFAGKKLVFKAYNEAIKQKYRFYSYGDAMFIV